MTANDIVSIISAVGAAIAAIIASLNRRTATTIEKKTDANHIETVNKIESSSR